MFFTRIGLRISTDGGQFGTDYTPLVQSATPMVSTLQAGDWTARVQVNANWGADLLTTQFGTGNGAIGLIAIDPDHPQSFWKFTAHSPSTAATDLPFVNVSNGSTQADVQAASLAPYLQVVKSGDNYTFSTSPDGVAWTQVSQANYALGSTVKLAIYAQAPDVFFPFVGRALQFSINAPLPGVRNPQEIGRHSYDTSPDWVARDFATGFRFLDQSSGPIGVAFDPQGRLLVGDVLDQHIYRFSPQGGVAGPATRFDDEPDSEQHRRPGIHPGWPPVWPQRYVDGRAQSQQWCSPARPGYWHELWARAGSVQWRPVLQLRCDLALRELRHHARHRDVLFDDARF